MTAVPLVVQARMCTGWRIHHAAQYQRWHDTRTADRFKAVWWSDDWEEWRDFAFVLANPSWVHAHPADFNIA